MKTMSKKEYTEKVRGILKNHNAGYICRDEHNLLDEYFLHHPDADIKMGCGVDYYYIDDDGYGYRCYWIKRLDGTVTDISLNAVNQSRWGETSECNQTIRRKRDVISACRHAIKHIIAKMRDKWTKIDFVCPISGKMVYAGDAIEIDHYDLNFADVVSSWLKSKNQAESEHIYDCINDTTDGITDTYFTDNAVVDDFVKYHNAHTHLRAVSLVANRYKGKSVRNIHDIFLGR